MLKFYTDGASTMKKINNEWIRCNGGAAMVCINDKNKIIAEYKRGFKNTTNNYCELHAIYLALSYWNNNYPNEEIEIYSDSAYCVNMLKENGWIIVGRKIIGQEERSMNQSKICQLLRKFGNYLMMM